MYLAVSYFGVFDLYRKQRQIKTNTKYKCFTIDTW